MGFLGWLGHCVCSPSEDSKRGVLGGKATSDGVAGTALDTVVSGIAEGKFKKIVVMTGAGISVNAGIPDFRSRTGMYEMSRRFSLPNAWAVFDIGFFYSTAVPFYYIVRKMIIDPASGNFASYRPTPTHLFFKLLEEKGLLLRVYTQNVDCLERAAGVSKSKLVQMHGHMADAHCAVCKKRGDIRDVGVSLRGRQPIDGEVPMDPNFQHRADDGTVWSVPRCKHCPKGVVKPDVVLFNEGIPAKKLAMSVVDLPRADLLLCFGSTFKVLPFCNFIGMVDDLTPRVLFNQEMVGRAEDDGPLASNKQCFKFTDPANYRDVFVQGDCDSSVLALCDRLGWRADLDRLVASAAVSEDAQVNLDSLEKMQRDS